MIRLDGRVIPIDRQIGRSDGLVESLGLYMLTNAKLQRIYYLLIC